MAKGKWKSTLLGIQSLIGHSSAPNWDFLYEASIIKSSRWNVGDRVVTPDGRAFRYGKCGAGLQDMKHGVKNYNLLVTELDAIAVAASIDDKYIDLTFDDSDGIASDGVIAVDSLRGGHISIYRGTDRQQRGIIGNTVRANGDTGNTRVYLDAALKVAVNALDNVEVMANSYSDLRVTNHNQSSVMGMPCVKATVGQYFWIQTWGTCRITPAGGEYGGQPNERQFMFDAFGSLVSRLQQHVTDASSYQHAGFLIERTLATPGNAAPFINLQINP